MIRLAAQCFSDCFKIDLFHVTVIKLLSAFLVEIKQLPFRLARKKIISITARGLRTLDRGNLSDPVGFVIGDIKMQRTRGKTRVYGAVSRCHLRIHAEYCFARELNALHSLKPRYLERYEETVSTLFCYVVSGT